MVTVRTYWNGVEAVMAKSLLDDRKIFCSLADENVNLYGGGPFAMPIRLLVDEDQADLALRILDGDLEAATEIETIATTASSPTESETASEVVQNNRWELIAIATLFLFPGICVLAVKYPAVTASTRQARGEIAAVSVIHFLGWLAVAFAVSLFVAYFYLRRSSITKAGHGV
jgi:hypothetical protein